MSPREFGFCFIATAGILLMAASLILLIRGIIKADVDNLLWSFIMLGQALLLSMLAVFYVMMV